MGVKLTWLPNFEADIKEYEIWRAPDNINFTQQATITHDTNDLSVYDPNIGRFYWEDPTGLTTYWYKIRAVDSADNLSGFTVAKQAGPPLPAVCVLFGTVLKANGEAETEAQIQIYIRSTEKTKEGQFVDSYGVTNDPVEVFTDDNGFWEVEIIRNAAIRVIIPRINLDVELTVPDAASAEITSLI